jgi:hypothetical protein
MIWKKKSEIKEKSGNFIIEIWYTPCDNMLSGQKFIIGWVADKILILLLSTFSTNV